MKDTTTIQVNRSTVDFLDRLKRKYGVSSYDKAIQKLGGKEKTMKKSMFGAHPKIRSFKREDEFHDL